MYAHPEVVEEVRRRKSKRNLTAKKISISMVDSTK